MSTNPLTLTTELEAVNLMLQAIGESRVTTLDTATHEDAGDALRLLRHWNMTVQEQGWRFNYRKDVKLTRGADLDIDVPENILRVEPSYLSPEANFSMIEGKLFNLDTNSFEWADGIYVNYVLLYDFEVIPQAARSYILQEAGLEFIGNEVPASNRGSFSAQRREMALRQLRRTESITRRPNMLTGSIHTLSMLAARPQFIPR
jgi:hypothetical protein